MPINTKTLRTRISAKMHRNQDADQCWLISRRPGRALSLWSNYTNTTWK